MSTAGASGPVVSVIVAPAGGRSGRGSYARGRRAVRRLLAGRDQLRGGGRGVQLRAVLLGDLGADLGRLLTDRVADVGGVQRHDHLVPEIFHGAPPRPLSPAGFTSDATRRRRHGPAGRLPNGRGVTPGLLSGPACRAPTRRDDYVPIPAFTPAGPAAPARRRRSRGHGRACRWRSRARGAGICPS